MSSLLRSIKNVTNGYTSAQVKVRNATSNDEFGPSTYELQEIADLTRSNQELFFIMDMIDKRLNDKGKNWRHVLKSLTLLDYLVRNGSDNVIIWCRENFYVIKSLREFQYRDESGEDHGTIIRNRAKDLTSLLNNSDRLRAERQQARTRRRPTRDHARPIRSDSSDFGRPRDDRDRPSRYRSDSRGDMRGDRADTAPRRRNTRGGTPEEEADELRRAIELSKQTVEDDEKRRAQLRNGDQEINKALQMSHTTGMVQQQTGLYTQEDWNSYQAAQQEYQQYQQQLAQQQQLEQQLVQQQQALAQQQQEIQQYGYSTWPQGADANAGGAQATGYNQPQSTGYNQAQTTGFQTQSTGYGQTQTTGYTPSGPPQYSQATGSLPTSSHATGTQSPAPLQAVKTGSNNPFSSVNTGQLQPQFQQQQQQQPQSYAPQQQPQHTNNPFQQQYTGIATTQMQPSHTGFGFGNAHQNRGGDSLIDL